jgi:hypothetical protein
VLCGAYATFVEAAPVFWTWSQWELTEVTPRRRVTREHAEAVHKGEVNDPGVKLVGGGLGGRKRF